MGDMEGLQSVMDMDFDKHEVEVKTDRNDLEEKSDKIDDGITPQKNTSDNTRKKRTRLHIVLPFYS